MAMFKAGDRFRVLVEGSQTKIGDLGTVRSVRPSAPGYGSIYVTMDSGVETHWGCVTFDEWILRICKVCQKSRCVTIAT